MGLDEGGEEGGKHNIVTCQENWTRDKQDANEDVREELSQGKISILFRTRCPHLSPF